ncbi:MAG: hypothetical protein ACE5LH_09965, partial [Fidelibacterota bacterium]
MKTSRFRWTLLCVGFLAAGMDTVSPFPNREDKMKQRIRRLQKAARSTDYAVGLIDAGKLQ